MPQDPGLNVFSPDGNTPTGLILFDLNSPEDDPRSFGPYPVNRAVKGLRGNAAFLVPDIRNGILMHTGEWPGWTAPSPMPNSSGCVHAWPDVIKMVWLTLVNIGVQVGEGAVSSSFLHLDAIESLRRLASYAQVRPNTDGRLPYPYQPQGLLSIELVD